MISRTKTKLRTRNKTNPILVETLSLAIKNRSWEKIAKILSSSTKKHPKVNLSEIDKEAKLGDVIVVPGKILSNGNLTKKVMLCALSISKQAEEKLKETKSEFTTLIQEIKKNPKAEGIKIIK